MIVLHLPFVKPFCCKSDSSSESESASANKSMNFFF